MNKVGWVVGLLTILSLAGCGKQADSPTSGQQAAPAQSKAPEAAPPAPPPPPVTYAYDNWSDWDMDCAARSKDTNAPCAVVRKRVCRIEGTKEGVACEHCGGQCREVVEDATSSPLHIYSKWGSWNGNCGQCDPESKPCKMRRTRVCLDRVAGKQVDCEFCGGACTEDEERTSTCDPDCKWTRVHTYSDASCNTRIPDDMFAGQWGPQTGSPFNSGCSETQPSEQCVKFGRNYYKWEACTPGCNAPVKK